MLTETSAADLAAATRAYVIAPAGFGKTELISQTVERSPGRSLVLTHTNAGVNALRVRLRRLGVPRERYDVATIAGWGLRWSAAYPALSGLGALTPTGAAWSGVYTATSQLLSKRVGRELLKRSYSGVFVDEYQDCNLPQHEIVTAIADQLPCRLLGDPLQGIFDFSEPTIDWQVDVAASFERLPDLRTPHRWLQQNVALGEWIVFLRERLIGGHEVDFRDAPLDWYELSPVNQYRACMSAIDADDSVVAIGKWDRECHELASRLRGAYSSMEEMDCRGLMTFCRQLDASEDGFDRVTSLLRLAPACLTGIRQGLSALTEKYAAHDLPEPGRYSANRRLVEALNDAVADPVCSALMRIVRLLERYPGARLYRRELWMEVKTTLLTYRPAEFETIEAAAWYVRDRSRRNGRRPENRSVSRVLLIKGLEFDRAVVLDATPRRSGGFSAKEAYVALTRGTRMLAVLSSDPVVTYPAPTNIV